VATRSVVRCKIQYFRFIRRYELDTFSAFKSVKQKPFRYFSRNAYRAIVFKQLPQAIPRKLSAKRRRAVIIMLNQKQSMDKKLHLSSPGQRRYDIIRIIRLKSGRRSIARKIRLIAKSIGSSFNPFILHIKEK